jgi:DNA-binding MarR family transcriptional regulator
MRPGDRRVLAYLSRVGEATVSSVKELSDALHLSEAKVQSSLTRLCDDGLVSAHGRGGLILWMSREQSR